MDDPRSAAAWVCKTFFFLGKGVAGAWAFGEDGRPSERFWNSAARATGAVVPG